MGLETGGLFAPVKLPARVLMLESVLRNFSLLCPTIETCEVEAISIVKTLLFLFGLAITSA